MQSVILAAGKGLRLRPITETLPKALVDINGQTLIQRILNALPDTTTEILIVVGYRKEQIMEVLGDTWNGKPIRYVVQDPLNGTGGALQRLQGIVQGKFLVVNGDDVYTKADLERLCAHELGLLVYATLDNAPSSALLDAHGCFEGIEGNTPIQEEKLRVCGAYVLDERFFKYPLVEITAHGHGEWSLPHTLITLSRDACVHAERASHWYPVGTPEELAHARTGLPNT